MASIEVRVHGIGDHQPLSALGSALRVHDLELAGTIAGHEARPLPEHRLWLLNWSRTSRRRARFLWYLALPFTLVNVAGEMCPPHPQRRDRFRAVTTAAGLVLSLTAVTWLLVIVETLIKRAPHVPRLLDPLQLTERMPLDETSTRLVFAAVAALIAAGLIIRARYQGRAPDRSPIYTARGRRLAQLHAAVLAGYVVLVGVWRPAAHTGWSWLPDSCTPTIPGDRCGSPPYLDLPTLMVVASTALLLVFATIAWWLAEGPDSAAVRGIGAGAGAAFALGASLVIVHAVGSLLRLGLDYLFDYFARYPAFDRTDVLGYNERVVLVFDDEFTPVYTLDTVATYAVLAALCVALAILLTAVLRSRPSGTDRRALAVMVHNVVLDLPGTLRIALPAGMLTWAVGSGLIYLFVFHESRHTGGYAYAGLVTATHAMAVAMILFVLTGSRSTTVRTAFGSVADILGFWPVCTHPLAGRSYRDDVIAGIHDAVRTAGPAKVVLVGHSQGSVLCAWLVRRHPDTNVRLVTCGSPLASLYGTFFPATFNTAFFAHVAQSVPWTNYWRDTDPIATSLPTASAVDAGELPADEAVTPIANVRLPDDDASALKMHSDYWVEPNIATKVTGLLA